MSTPTVVDVKTINDVDVVPPAVMSCVLVPVNVTVEEEVWLPDFDLVEVVDDDEVEVTTGRPCGLIEKYVAASVAHSGYKADVAAPEEGNHVLVIQVEEPVHATDVPSAKTTVFPTHAVLNTHDETEQHRAKPLLSEKDAVIQ